MNDPEVIELKNRFLLGVFIAAVFCIPLILFMCKFVPVDTDVYKYIKQGESLVIFVEEDKCDKCDNVKNILDNNNVSYFVLDKESNDYYKILDRLRFEDSFVRTPGLIFVRDGKLGAYIFEINTKEDVQEFIDLNKLKNTK